MKKTNIIFLSTTILFVIITIVVIKNNISKKDDKTYPWYFESLQLNRNYKYQKRDNPIKVAFLDTGLDYNILPLMKNDVIDGYNCITDTTDFNDLNGHGTSVISLAAFKGDEIEYEGIYKDIEVVPVVVADETGKTCEEYLYKRIEYAISKDVDIINISLGSQKSSEKIDMALYQAYCNNILVICSTGDYKELEITFPARSEYTIAISSQSILGIPFLNANYDDTCLFIPGESISVLKWNSYDSKFDVGIENGSSYACAIFTGIAAMYLSNENNNVLMLRNDIQSIIATQNNNFFDTYSFVL
jgi:subtilisin family serine protease